MRRLSYHKRVDFKYVVSLPLPHDRGEVKDWLDKNGIPYMCITYYPGTSVEYKMTQERHAVWFTLAYGGNADFPD